MEQGLYTEAQKEALIKMKLYPIENEIWSTIKITIMEEGKKKYDIFTTLKNVVKNYEDWRITLKIKKAILPLHNYQVNKLTRIKIKNNGEVVLIASGDRPTWTVTKVS